ncbi:MAG: response regulator, partial [Lachnospiraceae bacterium]|nr:response regulator [Lachnospiraceae bacterium]
MRLIKSFKNFFKAMNDTNRDMAERVFLRLTAISELSLLVSLLGDILLKEHIIEIVTIAITLILVPIVTLWGLNKEKLRVSVWLVILGMVVFVLPNVFFFGGGITGGGMVWILFAFLYIGMILKGKGRNVMLFLLVIMTAAFVYTEYSYPELIYRHTGINMILDIFISYITLGYLLFFLSRANTGIYTAEVKRALDKADKDEQFVVAQNRFFSSMSHEIRTPINSIIGLNELILRDPDAGEGIVKDATSIQGAGKMLLSLINDILDFSKMEAGMMDIVPVEYKVEELISDIADMIWLKAEEKGLEMEISIDPDVPSVLKGDEIRIKQILINLLNNAVKYTIEGKIGLRVEGVRSFENEVDLRISVSDTGMGIKKDDIPYLFTAFKRVEEENNRHIEGTGLGLSIVKQLLDLMGGTIEVNSIYGEGTTFSVVLKQEVVDETVIGELNIQNREIIVRNTYKSSFTARDARILIVDDNEMNVEVESRLLSETGIHIDKVYSGKDALEMTLHNHYDCIFMDHLMPEMDGIKCLELIKRQTGGINKGTPVVVLTANAGSENQKLYRRAGFDDYLVKPVSGKSLEGILLKHLPSDKVILGSGEIIDSKNINLYSQFYARVPILITTTNACDLPDTLIKKMNIQIIPGMIHTDEGVFQDGVQIDA